MEAIRELDWTEDIIHLNLNLEYGDKAWTVHDEHDGEELAVVYLYQGSEFECSECMHKPGCCWHITDVQEYMTA